MHVHRLTVENFKRIQAVTIGFPERGGTVEICGRNGQGKSSAIDALWAAMGGKDASPDQPIRAGQRSAIVTLDLGDYEVKRTWDQKGSKLVVTDAKGDRLKSPQTLLDGLFARLAFDPMEFTRQKPEQQAETLRRVAGLDFTQLDSDRRAAYDERTEVNRAVKAQEIRLADIPEVSETAETDVAALTAKLREANQANKAIREQHYQAQRATEAAALMSVERHPDVVSAATELTRAERVIDDTKAEITRLEYQLREAKGKLAKAIERRDRQNEVVEEARRVAGNAIERAKREAAHLQSTLKAEIDTDAVTEAIQAAEATNRRARQWRERQAALAELAANRKHAEDLTVELDRLDAERTRILNSAKMPVEGLSLDGEMVTFKGIPFSQAATAEKTVVSLAIAAALNPKLRLIIIGAGSLLDDDNLRVVARWAEQHDYQVVLERVADAPSGAGVVIEEGLVKSDAAKPARAETTSLFPEVAR